MKSLNTSFFQVYQFARIVGINHSFRYPHENKFIGPTFFHVYKQLFLRNLKFLANPWHHNDLEIFFKDCSLLNVIMGGSIDIYKLTNSIFIQWKMSNEDQKVDNEFNLFCNLRFCLLLVRRRTIKKIRKDTGVTIEKSGMILELKHCAQENPLLKKRYIR